MRTQILLDLQQHRRAKDRAARLGVSLSEYIRRVVAADLEDTHPRRDVGALFDLGDSGGSDIALHKARYLGKAAAQGNLLLSR